MSLSFIHPEAKIINTNDNNKCYICTTKNGNLAWSEGSFNIHKFFKYRLNNIADDVIPQFVSGKLYYADDCVTDDNKYYICKRTHYASVNNLNSNDIWYEYTDELNKIKNGDYTIICKHTSNELKFSEDFSNNVWIKDNVTSQLEYSKLGIIISPKINNIYAYNLIASNKNIITNHTISQEFNASSNTKYKFSIYLKNIHTSIEYLSLTLFNKSMNIGASVVFNIKNHSYYTTHMIDNEYNIVEDTKGLFSNIDYDIDYLNGDYSDLRLTISVTNAYKCLMSAQIHMLNDDIKYIWKATGVYKTYITGAQVAKCSVSSSQDAPTYLPTVDKTKYVYTIEDIYLKTSNGNIKKNISYHSFANLTPTESMLEGDIGTMSSVITLNNGVVLGNYDPYPPILINQVYGVMKNDTSIDYEVYGVKKSDSSIDYLLYHHPVNIRKNNPNCEYIFYSNENKEYYIKTKDVEYKALASDKHFDEKNKKAMLKALTFNDSLYSPSGKVITSSAFNNH